MTALLIHFLLLASLSVATARHLLSGWVDRLIAAAFVAWSNIVATCLLLSWVTKLGQSAWIFRASLVLALVIFLLVRRFARPVAPEPRAAAAEPPNPWLVGTALGTLGLILLANLAIAAGFEPNNYDSMTYHLPRVIYYLGQGSLAQFETADFRQVYYPFNFNLLQLVCFAYEAPPRAINFLNVAAWVVAGLSVYRISCLSDCSVNASIVAAWLTLTATQVLAQATSTILDLPTATALAAALVFVLRWRSQRRPADALLAGVAASMCAGTKLTATFFGPPAAVLIVFIAWRHWRRAALPEFFRGIRAWVIPVAVAGMLCAPFVLFNLQATGHLMTDRMDFTLNKPFTVACALQTTKGYLVQMFCEPLGRYSFDLEHIDAVNRWFAQHVFQTWNPAHAFSELFLIPPDLNEDHVFFGLAGPLFILCALACLARDWRLRQPATWMALLGLGWFAFYFATNKWSLYNQRYFISAVVVLGPCAGAVWDGRLRLHAVLRAALGFVFWIAALSGLWFSGHYLVQNNIRPLPFVQDRHPQVLPQLPDILAARLAEQMRLQVVSYGTNERIFPLLHVGRHQRVTSGSAILPGTYTLFSFWEATRNCIYSNLAYYASYTLVSVPEKKTAGVEFLGNIPGAGDAFDYVGFPADADTVAATPATCNIAVIAEYTADTNDRVRLGHGRLRVVGLNPHDAAHAVIDAEMADGTVLPLLSVAHSDWSKVAVPAPFKRLAIRVVDDATGRVLGTGEMPFTVWKLILETKPPPAPDSLFSAELVAAEPARVLSVQGLAALEGPYAQWDMPVFRWAKQPAVQITVPPYPNCTRLRLKFSLRLQVRDEASIEVLHNGASVQTFLLSGRYDWHTRTIDVDVAPGTNVLELRDRTSEPTPDWGAYLERNPDVRRHLEAKGEPLEAGAKRHYETNGRAEGRFLPVRAGAAEKPRDSLYFAFRNLRVEGFPSR